MNRKNISGIILAGGRSSRMGTEKGLVEFRGRTLIEYAVEALQPHCDEILISANNAAYDFLGFEVVHDEMTGTGPMGGIYSCLKKCRAPVAFVISCDVPLVGAETVGRIVDQSQDAIVAVPSHESGHIEPLCGVYSKELLPLFVEFLHRGHFKLYDLLQEADVRRIQTGATTGIDPEVFANVNTIGELSALERKKENNDFVSTENHAGFTGNENTEGSGNAPELLPNLLMIAGTGRKVGKTTLACRIIKQLSKDHPVTGIKVSPHMHRQAGGQRLVAETDDYLIIRETSTSNGKDSSRMLSAGAAQVFYLQTRDRHIAEPFRVLMKMIPPGSPVVCESGALLAYARPGLFLLVKRSGQTAFKKGVDLLPYRPDRWVTFDGEGFDLEIEKLEFLPTRWNLPG